MNELLEKILRTGTVTDQAGKEYPLHSHTFEDQCRFLQDIIRQIQARVGVEIGLAYGISSLAICEAMSLRPGARHHIIDPRQEDWHEIGLLNLKRAGYLPMVEFYRKYSWQVLPGMVEGGLQADLAYVDSTKVFDILLTDVFFLHRLLRTGGVLVLDDCDFPGVRKLARYLRFHPAWRLHSSQHPFQASGAKRLLSKFCRLVPQKEKWFAFSFLNLDIDLGIHARCLAFKKVGEDKRNWDWHHDF